MDGDAVIDSRSPLLPKLLLLCLVYVYHFLKDYKENQVAKRQSAKAHFGKPASGKL
jgi:hypothetical protein